MASSRRILVIQTAFLGDLLLSVPLFKYLRQSFPQSEISLVCRRGFGDLFRNLGIVDHVAEIIKKDRASYKAAIRQLKTTDFDLLLSPHESLTSARMAASLKARHKIGFKKWWNSYFFTETVKKDWGFPDALRQMSLLQNHDPNLKKKLIEFRRQDLDWKKSDRVRLSPVPEWASPAIEVSRLPTLVVREKFQLPSPGYICLFPGSVWKTKQWTEKGFAELGQLLSQSGLPVVLMGGRGEEELASRIQAQIPDCLNLVGASHLMETLAILSMARLVVTNDSAGQHLAALVQAPTVAIFGPTVLDFGFRPWSSKATVVERQGLACRPCGQHGHHHCPIGTHECMRSIQATEVLERIEGLQKELQSL